MKIGDAFPSRYLKAQDLPAGQDVPVTLDSVQMETMEASGEEKPILYFVGKQKGLVLNRVNSDAISDVLGEETETWHGRSIVLFRTTTSFGGRTVPCIRLRVTTSPPPPPQQDGPPTGDNSGDVDEIPF